MTQDEEKKVKLVFRAICKVVPGSHGMSYFEMSGWDWNVFSKTFGWFQVSQDLTEEQQAAVKELFEKKAAAVLGLKTSDTQTKSE